MPHASAQVSGDAVNHWGWRGECFEMRSDVTTGRDWPRPGHDGFLSHGFSKLSKGPDAFAAILYALGVPGGSGPPGARQCPRQTQGLLAATNSRPARPT